MSTSTNAGKVMLGADGCPLVGHDGKIVLADSIYPIDISLPTVHTRWARYWTGTHDAEEPYFSYTPDDEIFDQDWGEDAADPPQSNPTASCNWRSLANGDLYFISMKQSVFKFSLADATFRNSGSIDVDWSRITHLIFDWRLYGYKTSNNDDGTQGVYAHAHIGNVAATNPYGNNEPWEYTTDDEWVELASEEVLDQYLSNWVLASGTHTFTPLDPTNPTFYAAVFFDAYSGLIRVDKAAFLNVFNFRVIYNLA